MNQPIPKWLTPYATGKKQGWAQSYTAYAEYYCVDGAADDLSEEGLEERLIMMRPFGRLREPHGHPSQPRGIAPSWLAPTRFSKGHAAHGRDALCTGQWRVDRISAGTAIR